MSLSKHFQYSKNQPLMVRIPACVFLQGPSLFQNGGTGIVNGYRLSLMLFLKMLITFHQNWTNYPTSTSHNDLCLRHAIGG